MKDWENVYGVTTVSTLKPPKEKYQGGEKRGS